MCCAVFVCGVVVSLSEGRKLALSLGWGFIETSALHSTNVEDALINITREVQRPHAFASTATIGGAEANSPSLPLIMPIMAMCGAAIDHASGARGACQGRDPISRRLAGELAERPPPEQLGRQGAHPQAHPHRHHMYDMRASKWVVCNHC